MNPRVRGWLLAGIFTAVAAMPLTADAGRGKGGGTRSQAPCPQAQSQTAGGSQVRQRLRDGSCGNPDCANRGGATNRRGNGNGPGDGTGNGGAGPKDGTGYGAPSQP